MAGTAPIWEAAFLEALHAKEGRILSACAFSGAARSAVYRRMEEDADFRARVRAIQVEALRAKSTERARLVRISLGVRTG